MVMYIRGPVIQIHQNGLSNEEASLREFCGVRFRIPRKFVLGTTCIVIYGSRLKYLATLSIVYVTIFEKVKIARISKNTSLKTYFP